MPACAHTHTHTHVCMQSDVVPLPSVNETTLIDMAESLAQNADQKHCDFAEWYPGYFVKEFTKKSSLLPAVRK